MSWDATFSCDCHPDFTFGEWNYTHNTNNMIRDAAERVGITHQWWTEWAHLPAETVSNYLTRIIRELSTPNRVPVYEATNPANGWGNRSELVSVLTEIRDMATKMPCPHTLFRIEG